MMLTIQWKEEPVALLSQIQQHVRKFCRISTVMTFATGETMMMIMMVLKPNSKT